MGPSSSQIVVVSNVSDASFALGVAHSMRQNIDIADCISLKTFANGEFCPRFLLDESLPESIGHGLSGKSVYLVSTTSPHYSRNELAMRNCLIAAAAKENGAESVVLIEPDLFYSAQDRGPRTLNHPQIQGLESRMKFVGQPCSAAVYARILKESGVDTIITVHNHKPEVMKEIYEQVFGDPSKTPRFINFDIAHLVTSYLLQSELASIQGNGAHIGFVAPDSGAIEFVNRVRDLSGLHQSVVVNMEKVRHGQRDVQLTVSDEIQLLKGRDVFVLDDMVRTGGTIAATLKRLAETPEYAPANLFFYCTHTYISQECRENLNSPYLKQFITTNTIPNILNRDDQGRLRKKTVVLKIEKWIADAIHFCLERGQSPESRYGQPESLILAKNWYEVDISTKNPMHHQSKTSEPISSLIP